MAAKGISRFCWDSSCFIAFLGQEANRCQNCEAILNAAKEEKVRLFASSLVLVEVVKVPRAYPAITEDEIQRFFRNPYVVIVNIDWFVAMISRDLQRRFSIGARDAVHLATAIHIQADELHSYDKDILGLRGRIPGVNLRIEEPQIQFQYQLPQP